MAARTLLVLDLRNLAPARLVGALGLSAFEAGQWARQGGYRLHRIADRLEAANEARRLAALDVPLLSLEETEVRVAARPLLALEGRLAGHALELRTAEGPLRITAEDLLLAVRGPITRERQAGSEVRRLRVALPEQGFRVHLHRRSELPPVELDPEVLAFGRGVHRSALLQINDWVAALARGFAVDDGFRRFPPALAPAQVSPGGVAGAVRALEPGGAPAGKAPLLLDNVAQFRFYSAWRGAVARHAPPE